MTYSTSIPDVKLWKPESAFIINEHLLVYCDLLLATKPGHFCLKFGNALLVVTDGSRQGDLTKLGLTNSNSYLSDSPADSTKQFEY